MRRTLYPMPPKERYEVWISADGKIWTLGTAGPLLQTVTTRANGYHRKGLKVFVAKLTRQKLRYKPVGNQLTNRSRQTANIQNQTNAATAR